MKEKTTRDFRVVHRPKTEPLLGYWIAEIHYDEEWQVVLYTNAEPAGDIVDELYEDMSNIMQAFDAEPLNLDYVDYLIERKNERKSDIDRL